MGRVVARGLGESHRLADPHSPSTFGSEGALGLAEEMAARVVGTHQADLGGIEDRLGFLLGGDDDTVQNDDDHRDVIETGEVPSRW